MSQTCVLVPNIYASDWCKVRSLPPSDFSNVRNSIHKHHITRAGDCNGRRNIGCPVREPDLPTPFKSFGAFRCLSLPYTVQTTVVLSTAFQQLLVEDFVEGVKLGLALSNEPDGQSQPKLHCNSRLAFGQCSRAGRGSCVQGKIIKSI